MNPNTSTRPARSATKAAEVASGLGAIVLGAGLALIAPDVLREFAVPFLIGGVLVHGAGMTLKHRMEGRQRALTWWERGLFWICWVALGVLAFWLATRLLRG